MGGDLGGQNSRKKIVYKDARAGADARPGVNLGAPPHQVRGGDLVLWLRAGSGVIRAGGKVTQWKDQSGNGLHLTAPASHEPRYVGSLAALNNAPALQFSGADKTLLSGAKAGLLDLAAPASSPWSRARRAGWSCVKTLAPPGTPGGSWS